MQNAPNNENLLKNRELSEQRKYNAIKGGEGIMAKYLVSIMLIAALFLSGCAMASKTYTATGREGYKIDCSGSANSWGNCYKKAGDLCKERGYSVITKSGDQGYIIGGSAQAFGGGTTISRSMVISCK